MASNVSGEADGPSDSSACGEDLVSTEMTENNRSQLNGKKKRITIKSFKKNLQRAGEISPLPLKNKETNRKLEKTSFGNDLENSFDQPVQSPVSPKEQLTKQESGRWRLRFGSKTENTCKQEQKEVCPDVLMLSENKSEVTGRTDEFWQLYTLPETPPVPLSVMQINNLIKNNVLEEAYLNILSLREEFQCEQKALDGKSFSVELVNKKKDLSLLYNNLKEKLTEIVQQSSVQPFSNKELLVPVAVIIEEEEKRDKIAGQMEGWKEVWRAAIERGLKETLKKIDLDSPEQNVSWLAVHLGQVGRVIVEQLKNVKAELISCYPPSFNVFETYVSTFHKVVKEHLKWLCEKNLKVKDYYALLDFILNRYHSEKIMGCNFLQPELKDELKTLKLEDDFLNKIKNAYYDRLQNIKGPIQSSSLLDVNMEHRVICCCLHELTKFPKREQIECFKKKCPSQVEQLVNEINGLINKLKQALLEQFKTDTKPFLKVMMTRKWMSSKEDFQKLYKRIETLSEQCKHMSPQCVQAFVNDVHFFVVKEYISQLMKNNYSCKNRKNEKAAANIKVQWSELCGLFQEMNSVEHWLYPVGDHLQKIIKENKESEIKNYLKTLLEDYPDFSQKHLSAVLYFRGIKRGRQRQLILQTFSDLQQHASYAGRTMTVGSSSSMVRRGSPSRSAFSKLKSLFRRNTHHKDNINSEEARYFSSQIQTDDLLTFQQNLQQRHFAAAGKQLICREEDLFSGISNQEEIGSSWSMLNKNEVTKLTEDYEEFLTKIMSTVENSFNVETNEDKEYLKKAVQAIEQEEEQDRKWKKMKKHAHPSWRPRCCRVTHDCLLQNMVIRRMEEAQLNSKVNAKSSVQREINAQAKQLKNDLLKIAKNVSGCYPQENICQLYANIYHQVFSEKLREIADYVLADEDCKTLLNHILLFRILRNEELSGLIDYKHLEALLPDDVLEQLEEQFLINRENELQTWCQRALDNEKKANPELIDNCYVSHLATDVIQCVDAFLTTSKDMLGSWSKIQRLTNQLQHFLINYQHFIEKVIEDNQVNTDAVLKANLPCIREFRNYITTNPDPFPEHIKVDCVNLLTRLRDRCLSYFTKPIHKNLKGTYSKLGTQGWIKHSEHVCHELLEGVHKHMQEINKLHEACFRELVSKLHEEVMAEYVRKMMKRKIKLKDEAKQTQAVEALCRNSEKICTLFTEAGSNMEGLADILPKLAELLTLNDPQCIELQLVTLANDYPDFTEAHVSAWLHLKANLSTSDLKKIKKTFSAFHVQTSECTVDGQDPIHSCRNFFSKVAIK
ncbi:Tumor necrosis factor alpha-induced protein 2 [Bagarius yarrelli]|uniref:Tumor necrosis factor alpha-induced protein 2 n=1 Tax=Bagarius yarrelli TaxID=175774 RepID=A0A556TN73_BAGYA|nr:Tumor necrosis factor alpha-induced protein 2 [Bagarius yarrelli]